MLSLIIVHLIALASAGGKKDPTAPQGVQTVCAANHCVGTKTNPIPRGQVWLSMGLLSQTGCCFGWKGACEQCIQPYSCFQYGEGEDNDWCKSESQKPNSPIVWTDEIPNRPDVYLGCGWCSCCRKTNPKTGLAVNHVGPAPGTMGDLKTIGGWLGKAAGFGFGAASGEQAVGQAAAPAFAARVEANKANAVNKWNPSWANGDSDGACQQWITNKDWGKGGDCQDCFAGDFCPGGHEGSSAFCTFGMKFCEKTCVDKCYGYGNHWSPDWAKGDSDAACAQWWTNSKWGAGQDCKKCSSLHGAMNCPKTCEDNCKDEAFELGDIITWAPTPQRCYGLQFNAATTAEDCKNACANDDTCFVYQFYDSWDQPCWMGQDSGGCHGGDGPTQGGRKTMNWDHAETAVGFEEMRPIWSEREEAQFAVVATEPFNAFDYGVYGFATLGFAVVVFGAYKHYSKKEEEYSRV